MLWRFAYQLEYEWLNSTFGPVSSGKEGVDLPYSKGRDSMSLKQARTIPSLSKNMIELNLSHPPT